MARGVSVRVIVMPWGTQRLRRELDMPFGTGRKPHYTIQLRHTTHTGISGSRTPNLHYLIESSTFHELYISLLQRRTL